MTANTALQRIAKKRVALLALGGSRGSLKNLRKKVTPEFRV
jgi:hypothetical protein